MAIYHDQFIDLKEELRQALVSEQVRQAAGGHIHQRVICQCCSLWFLLFLLKPHVSVELFPWAAQAGPAPTVLTTRSPSCSCCYLGAFAVCRQNFNSFCFPSWHFCIPHAVQYNHPPEPGVTCPVSPRYSCFLVQMHDRSP